MVNELAQDQSNESPGALIELIPLGHVDPVAISVVAANIQALIGLNANVLAPRANPDYAFLAQRQQFDAFKIIKQLSMEARNSAFRLGVTALDICTPILTFVYGESQLGGEVALISISRLLEGQIDMQYERAAKISVHEVGHLLGLEHCWEVRCLMHFSRDIGQLDSLPLKFCSACEYEAARRMRSLTPG